MRITRSLTSRGLLASFTDPRDGRVRALGITAQGRDVHRLAENNLLEAAEGYFWLLSEEDVDGLLRTLVRIL
jgi:DNA-binding MarR family transcriptional regulator